MAPTLPSEPLISLAGLIQNGITSFSNFCHSHILLFPLYSITPVTAICCATMISCAAMSCHHWLLMASPVSFKSDQLYIYSLTISLILYQPAHFYSGQHRDEKQTPSEPLSRRNSKETWLPLLYMMRPDGVVRFIPSYTSLIISGFRHFYIFFISF